MNSAERRLLALRTDEKSARESAAKRRTKTIWAWTTLGVGTALGITAGVLFGMGSAQGDEAMNKYLVAPSREEQNLYAEDVRAARQKMTAGAVLAGTAAAALGTAVYLFVTRPEEQKPPSALRSQSAAFGFDVSNRRYTVSVTGRF